MVKGRMVLDNGTRRGAEMAILGRGPSQNRGAHAQLLYAAGSRRRPWAFKFRSLSMSRMRTILATSGRFWL